MINYDDVTNESKTKHNPKWSYILDHPYGILIIGGSGSENTEPLLNLMNQHLINKLKKLGRNHFEDLKSFTENSNAMKDFCKDNIDEYNPERKK